MNETFKNGDEFHAGVSAEFEILCWRHGQFSPGFSANPPKICKMV
jgi:hypothetical protein